MLKAHYAAHFHKQRRPVGTADVGSADAAASEDGEGGEDGEWISITREDSAAAEIECRHQLQALLDGINKKITDEAALRKTPVRSWNFIHMPIHMSIHMSIHMYIQMPTHMSIGVDMGLCPSAQIFIELQPRCRRHQSAAARRQLAQFLHTRRRHAIKESAVERGTSDESPPECVAGITI